MRKQGGGAGRRIISYPQLGNYSAVIKAFLGMVFPQHEVRECPPITKRTQELGARHSPDFVCAPFKYNLGNFIEALEGGANLLLQAGGGCRYGFYGELQQQILRDLGYEFEFINLFDEKGVRVTAMYRECKRLGSPLSFAVFCARLLLGAKMIGALDELENYVRGRVGFEAEEGSFEGIVRGFLSDISGVRSFRGLRALKREYFARARANPVNIPDRLMNVGMVGELYTLMEPFSNYFMEKELARAGMRVSRFINVTYLLFTKKSVKARVLREAGGYLRYAIGADGTESVAKAKSLAEAGCDGIIHVKPFGCTPEVNAMPMLQNINNDYKVPVLYFSFDSQDAETGVKTRLEAFRDMIVLRKEKQTI